MLHFPTHLTATAKAMHPFFAHAVRFFAAGALGVCACVCGLAQTPPSALARPQPQATADISAPGGTQALQAEFPERKFPELREVLRQGLLNGPAILISEWNASASAQDALGHGGRADLLPSVNGSLQGGQTYEQHKGDGAPNRSLMALFYDVSIFQPVYYWNVRTNNYQIRKLYQAMSERNIAETRRVLAITIRSQYFNIILKANELKLARKNMERLERDQKEMEQAIKDGTVAAGAIDGPNRNIQFAKPEITRLENELAGMKKSLVQLTGLPDSTFDKMPDEIPALPETEAHDALYALSSDAGAKLPPSSRLLDLTDSARIAKLNFDNSKKILYPTLGVWLDVNEQSRTANYSNQGERYVFTTWSALAQVNWSIFDGFNAQAARRASLERLKAAEAARSQAAKQEGDDRSAEVAALQVQWEKLLNTERDLGRTRGGMEITEQDFKNGTASARDAENARVGYDNALQATEAARAAFYIALVTCLSNRGQDPVIMAMQE